MEDFSGMQFDENSLISKVLTCVSLCVIDYSASRSRGKAGRREGYLDGDILAGDVTPSLTPPSRIHHGLVKGVGVGDREKVELECLGACISFCTSFSC